MIKVLLISLFLTLILELAFAVLYGVREPKSFGVVLWVNVLTNPVVVSLHYLSLYRRISYAGWITLGLEIAAVLTEGLIYRKTHAVPRPFFFSLAANSFSYAVGALINEIR